jgi:Tfp pilus assembly protein PilO
MRTRTLSAPMAWALLVLVLIIGYVGIVNPAINLHAEREKRITMLGDLFLDRKALIARGQALSDQRKILKHANNGRAEIISARDTAAVARLQEHLRLAAADQGLRVDTLRVLSDRDIPPLREVVVQASLSGSVEQAQRLLHRLESGIPVIRISNLNILGRPGTPDLEIMLEVAALAESATDAD